MAICRNRGAVIDGSLAVVTIGVPAISAGSTGWRGVITSGGVFVRACFSGDCVSNNFCVIVSFVCGVFASVNCGSGIVSDIQIFSFI